MPQHEREANRANMFQSCSKFRDVCRVYFTSIPDPGFVSGGRPDSFVSEQSGATMIAAAAAAAAAAAVMVMVPGSRSGIGSDNRWYAAPYEHYIRMCAYHVLMCICIPLSNRSKTKDKHCHFWTGSHCFENIRFGDGNVVWI